MKAVALDATVMPLARQGEAPYEVGLRGVEGSVKNRNVGEIGERLPSRAQLAEEYGVGRNVTQRAVERLIVKGLLEGRAGSGTYVRVPRERLRIVRSRHRERRGGELSQAPRRPWPRIASSTSGPCSAR